jgi:predicted Zn-dependent protease
MLLTLAGCATLDPEGAKLGPPSAETSVPSTAPRTTGIETRAAADQNYVTSLFGGIYRAPQVEAHLNSILARLAAASDTPQEVYKVTLLNSPVVNAFALPSGDLFVTRGLLALANDSSEIAAVMAHEIGHVVARHAFQREEQQKLERLRTNVANVVQNRQRGEEIEATGKLNLASFSRQQELEADRYGVALVGKAGFDPYGAARFLRSLGRSLEWRSCQQDANTPREQVDIMSSHPSTPGRIQQAIVSARQIGAPGIGDPGRDAYLDAINGIDFGDDPAEGIVRGRTFTHQKLGFTFTAPEGFSLENCSQAMIGVTPSRMEAIRLDIVQLPAGSNVDDYIGSGWVEGLKKESVQLRTINGQQAAVAEAESNGWKFRVGVVRLNGEVARIIFAARNLTPELDARFVGSIESFRKLQAGEAQRVRASRIAVVRAASTDTAESLARRMSVSARNLDLFLMLNGIQKGKPLDSGARYKLVVD